MSKQWFYPIQKELEKHLSKQYKSWRANWQVVTAQKVFEHYMVWDLEDNVHVILVVMTAGHLRGAQANGFMIYVPHS